ncbi:MAG: prolyl oligopeptidase family serine peptidase [Fibrobacteria bacterium]|nr:prolyl oligopeptidase family serine peptidase [Fibrobacteria bacterium]
MFLKPGKSGTIFILCIFFSVFLVSLSAQVKVACVGNSLTYSLAWDPVNDPRLVARLGRLMGDDYDVHKPFAQPGRTALRNAKWSIWKEQEFKDIFTWKPNIITIMLGTNDSKAENWSTLKDQFEDDYKAMIDTFSTISPKPLIIPVLPPHAGEGKWNIYGSVIFNEVIPRIRNVAEAAGLEYIDVNTPTRDSIQYFSILFPDSVHSDQNSGGHQVIADIYREGILNLYEKRRPRQKQLWYGKNPGALGEDYLVDKPTLHIYPAPDSIATGVGIIICPGGSYQNVAMDIEGHPTAKFLNDNGITAFVLRYRVSPYKHPIPLGDVKQAMRIVRHYADDYNLDTTKIGIMGFSAGGHLASTLLTHYDNGTPDHINYIQRKKSKPDFGILIYPVITLSGTNTHTGSRDNLLGTSPDQSLITELSNHLQVTSATPPTFMGHGDADTDVPFANSAIFDSALNANGVESELFTDPGKAHGYGIDGQWPAALINWLGRTGVVKVKDVRRNASLNASQKVIKIYPGDSRHKLPAKIYYEVSDKEKVGASQLFDSKGNKVKSLQN